MREIASRFATASTLPLMLDSTEPAVVETGLEMLGGRCIVNSVNYEDGDGPGSRIARMMPLVREHGAAVIALTIDERGQARERQRGKPVALGSGFIAHDGRIVTNAHVLRGASSAEIIGSDGQLHV
jgi:5-methyltetrahydrofolate--homocysteine methyltransferase